jgi:hypothetical protein
MRFRPGFRSFVLGLSVSGFAAAQPAGSNLEAGGLAPPPAVESAPAEEPPNATEQELERAEREDSGRGLEFFWLNAEVGLAHLGLRTLSDGGLVRTGDVDTTYTGPIYGSALGLRMLVFTFGARFRLNDFSKARLWTLDGEAGMHVPLGVLEPYFTLGGGYTSLGAFEAAECAACDVSGLKVRGFNLRAAAGLDWYLGNTLSIGASLSGDVLFLSRPKLEAAELAGLDPAFYGKDGSSIGAGISFSAVVGLHF